jgi:creatinine amidohydrolase/Fe(II)-dependent formamide hydrolase-like protein
MMRKMENSNSKGPINTGNMTFTEVEAGIRECSSLIMPLGGTEPYGKSFSMGIATLCASAIADNLSSRLNVMVAPVLPFGCSTAYRAFGGTAGLKPRTFTNLIIDICRDWIAQGFSSILLIDSLDDNSQALDDAICRLNKVKDGAVKAFSIQADPRVRKFVSQMVSGVEYGRSEFMIQSFAAWLLQNQNLCDCGTAKILPDEKVFRQWKKRGKDPQKFRKLFPDAVSSSVSQPCDISKGRDIFYFIMDLLVKEYSQFLYRKESP